MDRVELLGTSIGMAGTFRVAAELLLRGFKPYIPVVDNHGVDIVVLPNIRIQVKTTRIARAYSDKQYSYYRFDLRKTGKRGGVTKLLRHYSATCDFLVLHGLDEQRFWIVPSGLLDNQHAATISTREGWKDIDIDLCKRLRTEGLSYKAIGVKLGVNHATIYNRLNGRFVVPRRLALTYQLRDYEDKWGQLTQCG